MVKAFVDFDQENVQKKTAIRYYKNVPRYITRRFKRENALKTVATENTPEKIIAIFVIKIVKRGIRATDAIFVKKVMSYTTAFVIKKSKIVIKNTK